MIFFLKDTELSVVLYKDVIDENPARPVKRFFKAETEVEGEVFDETGGDFADLIFGDGSVALGVNKGRFVFTED